MPILTIDPGRLRVELALEEATQAPDGAGGFTESWTEVALVFAEVEPLAARDRFGAGQTLEEVSHRVTMRHRADVRSGMRLVRGGRRFLIATVHDPDESGRYLVCNVREEGL